MKSPQSQKSTGSEFIRPDWADGSSLPLMESFHTIQGEGYHQGKAAYFIRLAGCDVGCPWCDVKESWDASAFPLVSVEDLAAKASASAAPLAVVTGGEPALYQLGPLCDKLKAAGMQTNIETSGAYPLSGHLDWVCLSPKKFKAPIEEVYDQANELKIIVFNKSDFLWAEEHAAKVGPDCKLYLQPEWGKREAMMPLMVDYVLRNPKWQISIQSHKYMGVD